MRVSRFINWLAALAVAGLVGCGGSSGTSGTAIMGGGGSSSGGTAAAVVASDLVIVLSAASIANSGNEAVTAKVTAIDSARRALSGVRVAVSVDANAVITPKATVTDVSGMVEASVGIGSDPSLRTITVTATSGSISRSVTLPVRDAGGAVTAASDLILTLSSPTIASSGVATVTATATALDARRNVLPGADVSISVDANAVLVPSGSVTNSNGVVTAAIGIGSDTSLRTINVTARSGTTVRTATLQVSTMAGTGPAVASDLSLSLSAPRVANSGTATVIATATAVDANRNALAGIPVTIRVDASAVATVSGTSTDTAGQVLATVGIGADRSNRVVTVTATSGTLTRSQSFVVDGAELRASYSPRVTAASAGNQVEYALVDTNGLPMSGQVISVTAPGMPTGSGVTDANGKYIYSYTAPATDFVLTAAAAGASRQVTIEVGGGGVAAATVDVQSASVTASPSVVTVNTAGSQSNQVELRALFYGAGNQPIPRMRVRFDLADNANASDGAVAWLGGTYAYSDANGAARGTFTPGQRSSPTNGVTVRICYDKTDFVVGTCPNEARTTLTVVQEALAVSIRTNETIKEGAAGLTYIKEFVVMVVDSAGQAKPDVLITPSVDLPAYYKGYYEWRGTRWVQTMTLLGTENYQWNGAGTPPRWDLLSTTTQPSCPQEDVNRNGIREADPYVAAAARPGLAARGEDLNWNGSLDARKSDVAVKMVSSAKTDANGLAVLQIEYGKDLASWVDYVITVTASGVSGTEARARYSGLRYGLGSLPYPGVAVTSETIAPAFVISPYGRANVCSTAD